MSDSSRATPPETGYFAAAKSQATSPTQEEVDYAFFAHLLPAIANLIFLGFLIPVLAPLVLLLATKQRSAFLMFHIHQSVLFQASLFVAFIGMLFFAGSVSLILGMAAIPFYLLAFCIPIVGFILPLPVGSAAKTGKWSEYPLVGQIVLRLKKPFIPG